MDEVTLKKYNTFLSVFSDIDGSKLSHKERNEKSIEGSEFTYGEIEFLYFLPFLLIITEGRKGLRLWDLGCGAGKVLVTAALTGNFSEVCGVEYLGQLAKAAMKACENLEKTACMPECKIRVTEGDMTKVDWSNADLVYTSSICFPEELMTNITKKAKLLKKGARIATLKMLYDDEYFKVVYDFKVKMTWGLTEVYVLERI